MKIADISFKKELDNDKKSTYKIKFIDSCRSLSSSLSNLVNILSYGIHNIKFTDYKSYLEYISTKEDELLIFNCLKCSKNHKKHFNKELIKNYQMPFKLFEDLKDGNINPKEVLKNQARFKSDVSEIKTGGKKSINKKHNIEYYSLF